MQLKITVKTWGDPHASDHLSRLFDQALSFAEHERHVEVVIDGAQPLTEEQQAHLQTVEHEISFVPPK